MRPDTLSVILRSAGFIAMFQATGMVLFIAMHGRRLAVSLSYLRRITKLFSIAAAVLLVGQYALEAARMADDMSGIGDPALQMLAMHSASSVVLALRLLGLSVIVAAIDRADIGIPLGVIGATVVIGSSILTGHTVANPLRWALAPLLLVHLTIVAFWFGAILPLYVVSSRENSAIALAVTEAFSRVAGWLVPGIFVAGFALSLILVHHLGEFRLSYGRSLLGKAAGFAILMGLAAFNKWRLVPAIASGNPTARRAFRCSLVIEYFLIAAVLTVTAVMTTLFSPEP